MKVPTQVLEVLDRAKTDGPRLTLTGTLDRKLYLDTAKVLEAAGGKSAAVTFRQTAAAVAFRAWVDKAGGEMIPLPEGSFKPSGTGVNTVIAVVPGPA